MFRFFRKLKYSIQNVIYFLPYIWKDRDWSSEYIYELLYVKFKKMERYWQDYDGILSYVGQEKDLKNIKIAKNLCKRISDDNYIFNALFWHDKKYGDYINFEKFIESEPNENGNYRWIGDTNKERNDDFMRCSKHGDNMKRRDIGYLHDLFKKQGYKWWI